MMTISNPDRNILYLSLPLAVLVILVSVTGIFTPDFYSRETSNWQAQSIGQDFTDLILVVPVFLIATLFAYRGNKGALLVWAGTVIYLLYTFLIYCFAVHFNKLFPVYCLTLGLSFYSMMYFIYGQTKSLHVPAVPQVGLLKFTGVYFIILSLMFYLLWLAEIIPAIMNDTIPASLAEAGLPTNTVHVIDLSVFLPGMFLTGMLILRYKSLGYMLAPVLLTFFVLMDLTIGGLMVILKARGLDASLGVAAIMGVLALMSLALLILHLEQFNSTP